MLKMVLLVRRKEGLSREEFIAHYKSTHAPLAETQLKNMSGYKRTFLIPASEVSEGSDDWESKIPLTEQYDAMVEFEWASQEDFDADNAGLFGEAGKILVADEEKFMDRSSMRFFIVADQEVSDLS